MQLACRGCKCRVFNIEAGLNVFYHENCLPTSQETYQTRVKLALMALINNWDLTDENTAIYERTDDPNAERIYMVSDLGSTFGTGTLT